jgi:CRISPR-associated exonuclease Cas4
MCANIFFYTSSIYLEESLLKRKKYKVEKSKIEYVDYGKSDEVLISKEYGLSGKPDYITIDKNGQHIPIEIKTGKKPGYPYFSHIIQIGVYALLVDQLFGHCPGGLIRYGNKTFFVKLNEKLKTAIKDIRCQLIRELQNESMHRNHGRKGKCKNCSMMKNCPERLW